MWPKISIRLAFVLTKACLEALLHLQHIKCLDSSNFVLYFVKHSFISLLAYLITLGIGSVMEDPRYEISSP